MSWGNIKYFEFAYDDDEINKPLLRDFIDGKVAIYCEYKHRDLLKEFLNDCSMFFIPNKNIKHGEYTIVYWLDIMTHTKEYKGVTHTTVTNNPKRIFVDNPQVAINFFKYSKKVACIKDVYFL